jgi:hypothetical protein
MPLNDGDVVQLGTLVLQVYFDLLDSAQESLPE